MAETSERVVQVNNDDDQVISKLQFLHIPQSAEREKQHTTSQLTTDGFRHVHMHAKILYLVKNGLLEAENEQIFVYAEKKIVCLVPSACRWVHGDDDERAKKKSFKCEITFLVHRR